MTATNGDELVRMYSLLCTTCLRVWFATARDYECPYCGSESVADTGQADA